MKIQAVKGYVAICNECRKVIRSGKRPDGLPNGVSFISKERLATSVCTDCIMKMGEEIKKEGD